MLAFWCHVLAIRRREAWWALAAAPLRASVADDPEDPEDDVLGEGDLGGGGLDEEGDVSLLIDDVEDIGEEDDVAVDEEDDVDDDLLIESDRTDSLADLLRMGTEEDDEDAAQRERDFNATVAREQQLEARRRKKVLEVEEYEKARGIGLLTNDPICRAVVACVTTGSDADFERVRALDNALKDAFGPLIEFVHNPDEDPDPMYPFFEVWIEGYRMKVLHARNWQQDGDLTDEKIDDIIKEITYEISEEASHVIATDYAE